MTNPRVNITVSRPQHEWLVSEASRLGITIGELLRRIVDAAKEPKPK